jgi:hypothetical protein
LNLDCSYKGFKAGVLENQYLRLSVLIDKGTSIKLSQHEKIETSFLAISYEKDERVKAIRDNGDIG